jgi:diadenosine tetraphosphate (Ap4A) HIT family hydrolase
MSNDCDFCKREKLEARVFYEDGGRVKRWFAFLAAPPYTKGHTILAARSNDNKCPDELNPEVLEGIEAAMKAVTGAVQQYYNNKQILLASLRGNIPHFHFHLIPLWKDKEKAWRINKLYEVGHLFEYLGDLEKEKDKEAIQRRIEKDWDRKTQRNNITEDLLPDVDKLRGLTGYNITEEGTN